MLIRIYYEDTDSTGVVYHANYLKFCERARSELFFNSKIAIEEKGSFLVHSLDCRFISPAKLGDLVNVKTKPKYIKNASLGLEQTIFLENKIVFNMNIKLAYVVNGKPSKIPDFMRRFLQENTDIK